MKIKSVTVFPLPARPGSYGGQTGWEARTEVANPMSFYPRFKPDRALWRPHWPGVGCIVTDADGMQGFGASLFGTPVMAVINEHLGPLLVDEDADGTDHLWEMMMRLVSPYGGAGLSTYAVSAVDLALWDLKARREAVPVYRLAGIDAPRPIPCYATGNDTEWHMDLGFRATKLACPFGPADGADGLKRNLDLIARTRELIGPDIELMLDCWMAFDVDYAVALSDAARPYDLGWIEDCLTPEDIEAHHELRRRLPDRVLAGGEHWYGTHMFEHAAKHKLADIFQPDICWVGGFTACQRIAEIADRAGIELIPHAGMNSAFGQQFTASLPGTRRGEMFVGTPPGVPLEERAGPLPVPIDGVVMVSDEPGFGPWPEGIPV